MGSHVGAGSGHSAAFASVGKSTGGGFEIGGAHARSFCCVFQSVVSHGFFKLGEARHMLHAERVIVETFSQNDMKHGCDQGRVLAGPGLEIDIGRSGHLRSAGVDHDQFETLFLGLAQMAAGVRRGKAP